MKEVLDLLAATGWRPDGRTDDSVRYFRGRWGEFSVVFKGRLRFRKGGRRVTVGKFITCFYHKKKTERQRLKTKNIGEIAGNLL